MLGAGKHKVAVDRVSFTVEKGDVFGLLGVNGAGKTTTFKMLAGEVTSTSGDAYLNGMKISENLNQVRKSLGYCPQFDALLENLTVREQLELYYDMKGLPMNIRDRLIDDKIQELNLLKYERILSGTLSGGNKRKLSVACAMIGDPSILFLDEPSTGMDPQARRFMWKVISSVATEKKQSTIILTTHSMEEAEALSTRLGIMVQGNFRCMGTPQHIKNKFGEGYELEVKVDPPRRDVLLESLKLVKLSEGTFVCDADDLVTN
jgi:ATP-binding cassette subfamily A (ABC1) protein 3